MSLKKVESFEMAELHNQVCIYLHGKYEDQRTRKVALDTFRFLGNFAFFYVFAVQQKELGSEEEVLDQNHGRVGRIPLLHTLTPDNLKLQIPRTPSSIGYRPIDELTDDDWEDFDFPCEQIEIRDNLEP